MKHAILAVALAALFAHVPSSGEAQETESIQDVVKDWRKGEPERTVVSMKIGTYGLGWLEGYEFGVAEGLGVFQTLGPEWASVSIDDVMQLKKDIKNRCFGGWSPEQMAQWLVQQWERELDSWDDYEIGWMENAGSQVVRRLIFAETEC